MASARPACQKVSSAYNGRVVALGTADYWYSNVGYWPILLKKSKAQPHCKTVEMKSTSLINSNCYCKSI
jgi:hypothetical protein